MLSRNEKLPQLALGGPENDVVVRADGVHRRSGRRDLLDHVQHRRRRTLSTTSDLPTWLRSGNAESGREVLIAIAAAIITVVGVVFSITILALTLASQQFGPRMMRNFVRDFGNQVTLGVFVATFVYSVLALGSITVYPARQLRTAPEYHDGRPAAPGGSGGADLLHQPHRGLHPTSGGYCRYRPRPRRRDRRRVSGDGRRRRPATVRHRATSTSINRRSCWRLSKHAVGSCSRRRVDISNSSATRNSRRSPNWSTPSYSSSTGPGISSSPVDRSPRSSPKARRNRWRGRSPKPTSPGLTGPSCRTPYSPSTSWSRSPYVPSRRRSTTRSPP